MLADRHYLRRQHQPAIWSVTTILVILNLTVYIGQLVAERWGWDYHRYLALRPDLLVQEGHFWQLLTFQFLHDPDGILHILLNCGLLWFFGRQVESFLGRGSFLKVYLWSGVIGGLTQALVSWAFANPELPMPAVMGASAGVCGIIAAFAAMHWDQKLILWLFFCIPVPSRGKYVVLILMGLCGLEWWLGSGRVAHAAHFGGIWMGLVYIRWIVQADRVFNAWEAVRSRIRPRPLIERVDPPSVPFVSLEHEEIERNPGSPPPPPRPISALADDEPVEEEELLPDEFIAREVDPILDKIAAHGIECLTQTERDTLEKGRELVMGK
jgi:membrane associated rhomboid family serine protease